MFKRLEPVCARVARVLKLHRKSALPLSARNAIFRALEVNRFSDGEVERSFERFKPLPHCTRVNSSAVLHRLQLEGRAGREAQEVDRYIPLIFADVSHHEREDREDGGQSDSNSNSNSNSNSGSTHISLDNSTTMSISSVTNSGSDSSNNTNTTPAASPPAEVAAPKPEAEVGITLPEYKRRLRDLGERLDPRIWPIAASFFLTGTSLGIVVPCMPLLVSELGITPSQFGFVISSFALAKLLSNIPSTHYVDIVGRKPLMVAGLGMCALGLSGIGVSLYPGFGYPWIIACRVISGVGVSAFVAGSFMYLIDVSTHLNRARTNAPPSAGFNAGLALGPAMGGALVELAGISYAYFMVGGMFAGLALLNQTLIKETLRKQKPFVSSDINSKKEEEPKLSNAFQLAYSSWKKLFMTSSDVRNILLLNGSYWFTLSGAQLTLLPLLMISPALDLSISQIATCFGMMSITSFGMSQPLATLCDKYDKVYVSCGGCLLIASSCIAIPFVSSYYELLAALVPLAIGSTIINTAPPSHMANICTEKDRSQAVSLLRTVGDVGFLGGASTAGLMAAASSVQTAMLLTGGMLVANSLIVARRHQQLIIEQATPIPTPMTPGDIKRKLL
jgi:MFS family permease